ncbi:MAG: MarR family transcriptional regulator [Candidatus Omnitrophica bacterium]|nr:MarR family transcriptional regulator [Candidatus Omnitrophota bacterium]
MITEQYKEQIRGTLACYDRLILRGTIPAWCFAESMTSFLHAQKMLIFDYATQLANPLREEIRANAERLATESGVEIEFIRKIKEFRKEDRIKAIIAQRGGHPGLVHIFSAMEACNSYKPWHDKLSGRNSLINDSGKCLHYYFYFMDPLFGLCYLRVPTWCPFQLQFYFNGHNWLAAKLAKRNIQYSLQDNAFLEIADFTTAQELSDNMRVEDLHQVLDILAERYCPVIKTYHLAYHWSIMQAEYATDLVFKKQSDLRLLYEPLVRTAIHSVKPEHIATFLGAKLHWKFEGEIGNDFNTRIQGTRIKHQMGAVSIKMYDKFSLALRIETTANDVSQFRLYREVAQRDGSKVKKMAVMKKNIYSLFPLMRLLKASNQRYLEFISTFPDPSNGIKKLNTLSQPVTAGERHYKGFNFFDLEDQKLLTVIARGEFNISGFRNKFLQPFLSNKNPGQISRILKRLRLHGLIKKVGCTYKYYLTSQGKSVVTLGLRLKELFIIPRLAGFITVSF